MNEESVGLVLDGVWRYETRHPEWTEYEGDEEGWDPIVGWWILETATGLVLVDPLTDDWREVDRLAGEHGGVAGVIRTCHWHQRSIAQAAARYSAEVWAKPHPPERDWAGLDREVSDRQELFGAITAFDVERDDEVALWFAPQRVLIFGDAMVRSSEGQLRRCPDSWTQPPGGAERLRALLRDLTELPVEHVLVSHGPLVLGGGLTALSAATS